MTNPCPIPADVAALCAALEGAGFAAHIVGGAVRDLVLGHTPDDWDVATSARPEATAALFGESASPTGLPHGTVTVDTGVRRIEVTTFRREGPYSDGRRPDWVEFTDDLTVDLARRDFTMNAMALTAAGALTDPFGGADHLKTRTIRTVGPAAARFSQDGLRMFRAVRFSARLDFDLGGEELDALRSAPQWGDPISAERIRIEVEKGLCAPAPWRLSPLFSCGLLSRFTDTPALPDLDPLSSLPPDPAVRWGGLCAVLLSCGAIEDGETFLRRFHMDRRTLRGALAHL